HLWRSGFLAPALARFHIPRSPCPLRFGARQAARANSAPLPERGSYCAAAPCSNIAESLIPLPQVSRLAEYLSPSHKKDRVDLSRPISLRPRQRPLVVPADPVSLRSRQCRTPNPRILACSRAPW